MDQYLQPDVHLDVRGSRIVLTRDGVDVAHALGVGEAIALACLGWTGSEEDAAAICDQCLPDGRSWVSRVVNRYGTYLGKGAPRELDTNFIRRIACLRPQYTLLPDSQVKQEAAPAAVVWLVTLGCNRRCPYCYYDVFRHRVGAGSPPDATFSFEDARRMIREMARIGARDLFLTGGEPLLRSDLTELIACATSVRVRTHISTKYPIDRALAQRLANAGVTRVTVSLDDARPDRAARLAGSRGYLDEARRTIQSLLATGVELEVNSVLSAWSADGFEELAEWLAAVGAPLLTVSTLSKPYPRDAPTWSRIETDVAAEQIVEDLQRRYRGRLDVRVGTEDIPGEEMCGTSLVCEVGSRVAHVLPDGSVTRCRYLPNREELTAGSLKNATLLELWRSRTLAELTRPPRERYRDTACSDCSLFEGCHSRGRCYVSALQSSGRLHSADSFCRATEP